MSSEYGLVSGFSIFLTELIQRKSFICRQCVPFSHLQPKTRKALYPLYCNGYKAFQMVTRRGFEPRTHCLKGSCSAG